MEEEKKIQGKAVLRLEQNLKTSVCFFFPVTYLTFLFGKVVPQSGSYRSNSIPYNNAELHRYPKPKETYSLPARTNDREQVCHAMGTDGPVITQLRICMAGA